MTNQQKPRGGRIVSWGHYLPQQTIESRELEQRLSLEDGWITARTGVENRHVASHDQAVSDLATKAGKQAIQNWTSPSPRIGTLILATSTPDHLLPPTAPLVASQLELNHVAAFDIAVACSGFVYALNLADALVRTSDQAVLIVAANLLSRRCRPQDPATTAVFADGAGAVIVAPPFGESGIIDVELTSDGNGWEHLLIPDGGSRRPFHARSFDQQTHLMTINNGMAVFRYAVESMTSLAEQILKRNGLSASDIDLWIPHQANGRIVESVRKNLGLHPDQTALNFNRVGNTSAASIPIALSEHLRDERTVEPSSISCGQSKLCLLTAAAAGLTAGAALVRI